MLHLDHELNAGAIVATRATSVERMQLVSDHLKLSRLLCIQLHRAEGARIFVFNQCRLQLLE